MLNENETTKQERWLEEDQGLRSELERLEAANKELEAFASSVSHDLRTPLSMVINLTRAVMLDYGAELPAGAYTLLETIRANGEAMDQLIVSLRDFSTSAHQPLTKQRIHLTELVHRVWNDLCPTWEGRHIEFTVGNLPDCEADPVLLKQVLTNLLSNSIKFTRKRDVTQIEIGYVEHGGEYAYFVRDNGVGFDMKQAEGLFSVFQRFHPDDEYEGTGVGLAVVERIVRRHGGRVWAKSETGQGATFYFALPAK